MSVIFMYVEGGGFGRATWVYICKKGQLGFCLCREGEGHVCVCGCWMWKWGVQEDMGVCMCGRNIYVHLSYICVAFVCACGCAGCRYVQSTRME